jgi:hypothetical protein
LHRSHGIGPASLFEISFTQIIIVRLCEPVTLEFRGPALTVDLPNPGRCQSIESRSISGRLFKSHIWSAVPEGFPERQVMRCRAMARIRIGLRLDLK